VSGILRKIASSKAAQVAARKQQIEDLAK